MLLFYSSTFSFKFSLVSLPTSSDAPKIVKSCSLSDGEWCSIHARWYCLVMTQFFLLLPWVLHCGPQASSRLLQTVRTLRNFTSGSYRRNWNSHFINPGFWFLGCGVLLLFSFLLFCQTCNAIVAVARTIISFLPRWSWNSSIFAFRNVIIGICDLRIFIVTLCQRTFFRQVSVSLKQVSVRYVVRGIPGGATEFLSYLRQHITKTVYRLWPFDGTIFIP